MRGGRKLDEKFCNIIRRKKAIKTNTTSITPATISELSDIISFFSIH